MQANNIRVMKGRVGDILLDTCLSIRLPSYNQLLRLRLLDGFCGGVVAQA